jgi:hypothetical protein
MEYFLGSLLTILTLIFAARLFSKDVDKYRVSPISYTQSYTHDLISPLLPPGGLTGPYKPLVSQAQKHNDKTNIRVLFVDDKAYWIKDNKFFVAETEDGMVINDTSVGVDTMAMDSVELEKMVFIVDKLTEGINNDRGDSGNSKF